MSGYKIVIWHEIIADRLKNLALTSLENRRIRSDLIEMYKIINGYYNIDASLFFFNLMKVEEDVIQRNYIQDVVGYILGRMYLLTGLSVCLWNSLPDACINCTTLNQFKSHISKILEPEVSTQSCYSR